MTIAQVLIAAAGVLLVAAALFALWRIAYGPTGLDRGVAADVVIAVLIAGVAAHAMWTRTSLGLLVILVLSLLGFTGAVGLAKLIAGVARDQRAFHVAVPTEPDADEAASGGERP